ncbi:hypothetical protein [Candidatus Nitrosocosmicus franklandus]|nr:hypothetical protein [Candidatus Nitrosocosmicus franklandus]
MKDFEEMTEKEKEDFLKQVQNLPDNKVEDYDSFDLLAQSFDEISMTWTESIKEFETLYPEYIKPVENNPQRKYESKWIARFKKRFHSHSR